MFKRSCALMLGLLSILVSSGIAAPPGGKGGGGTATPPGTIYFHVETSQGDQTWGMDADGKNKFQALPQGIFGNPSTLLYGTGHRWWLVSAPDGRTYDRVIRADGSVTTNLAHHELFAVRWDGAGYAVWHQVCDSFGVFRFAPRIAGEFNGTKPDGGFSSQWSSEGLDTFAYSEGTDLRAAFQIEEDFSTTLDLRNGYNSAALCRVDVPGGLATLGNFIEAGVTLGPVALTILPGEWHLSNQTDVHFSPDGQTVLHEVEVFDADLGGSITEYRLRNASTGLTQWSLAFDARQSAQWSPLGGQIALSLPGADDGIWILPANAEGYDTLTPVFLLDTKLGDATDPRWSPDGTQLVFRQKLWSKGSYRTHLYRIKADGSELVQLTGDLDDNRKWPFRWTSNVVAP